MDTLAKTTKRFIKESKDVISLIITFYILSKNECQIKNKMKYSTNNNIHNLLYYVTFPVILYKLIQLMINYIVSNLIN
jgi:hypothetical protein